MEFLSAAAPDHHRPLLCNVDEPIRFSYRLYLENRFREALDLVGCSIHSVIRARKGMQRDRDRG